MVGGAGIEPAHHKVHDPKSCASAKFRQPPVAKRKCLSEKTKHLGIVDKETIDEIDSQQNVIKEEITRLEKNYFEGSSLAQLLRRPEIKYDNLPQDKMSIDPEVIKQVEIEVKYAGYIKRENERIESSKKYETQLIPNDFDYSIVQSLRFEAHEKLMKVKPENLGQASRISGVNPSDVSILSMWLKRSAATKI